jgi:hypothetical protein
MKSGAHARTSFLNAVGVRLKSRTTPTPT